MQLKKTFVLLFSLLTISLTANVTVYYGDPYDKVAADPSEVSQLPWEFSFGSKGFNIGVIIKNKSPGVIRHNVTCTKGHGAIVEPIIPSDDGLEDLYEFFDSTKIEITLKLYSSGGLCSSLHVAEGRTDWPADKKPFDIKRCRGFCMVKVDISDQCIDPPINTKSNIKTILKTGVENVITRYSDSDSDDLTDYVRTSPHGIIKTAIIKVPTNDTDPSLDTESNTTTTLKPVVINVTSNNLTDYVPTSPHGIIETSTIKVTTNSTNNATDTPAVNTTIASTTIITIISSIFGVVQLILIVIFILLWTRRNRANTTPALPATIHRFEPFYPNMLFRRECDREIAEIEEHVYEEVGPPIYDVIAPSICAYEEVELPVYEEINPSDTEGG